MSNDLYRSCCDLPYTKQANLDNHTFEATSQSLRSLSQQYDYSSILGTLSTIWPLEKALPFFERLNLASPSSHKIKTIATHYCRACVGGVARVQAQLMNLWVSMGYQVVLITEEGPNELDFPYPSSVKRVMLPPVNALPERLNALQKILTENHIDIYVNHAWLNSTVLWECMLTKLLHVPYIQHTHGCFACMYEFGSYGFLMPRIFRLCDIVIALSASAARFFQLYGCNAYEVQNPVPEDLLAIKQTAPLDAHHVLMVGRLSQEKFPIETIRIFELVHQKYPDAILDIVGGDEGNFQKAIIDYAAENHFADSIVFHGFQSQDEINTYYHTSDCMLFTSHMEGYPMVLLEAKAHGLPIVMYDLGYLTLVKDKKGVLLSPIGDIQTAADHIIALFDDKELRTTLGKASRESFEHFAAYDLAGTWKEIFALSAGCSPAKVSSAYYDSGKVPEADRFLFPLLLDEIQKNEKNILKGSLDYKIGHKLLVFPRFVFHRLLRILRSIRK